MKKVIITPFFGPLPPWFDQFKENFHQTLALQGYEWILTTNLNSFNYRCLNKLGFKSSVQPETGKVWDYRGSLGLLYEEEIAGFDYWGTVDFDMCFGDVNQWFPDKELERLDIWSNHHSYVNGCFSLYRNCKEVNELFKLFPLWQRVLQNPTALGWIEREYSRCLEASGLKYRYSFFQGWPYTTTPNLRYEAGHLFQDGEEIPMFHFRRSKRWPL